MGTPLGPKYIPYTYMDPLGDEIRAWDLGFRVNELRAYRAIVTLRAPNSLK